MLPTGLFKGKRVDNGEWIEGSLLNFRENTYIIPHDSEYCYDDTEKFAFDIEYFEVIPETVGQYTELTDKNNKKIFVGDIIEFQFDNDDCPFPDKNTKKKIGRVYFEKFRASFAIAMGLNGDSVLNNDLFRYVQNGNRVSVIGNIHDTSELLKGLRK